MAIRDPFEPRRRRSGLDLQAAERMLGSAFPAETPAPVERSTPEPAIPGAWLVSMQHARMELETERRLLSIRADRLAQRECSVRDREAACRRWGWLLVLGAALLVGCAWWVLSVTLETLR